MAQIALEVQTNAPRDPLTPAEATINSSYSEALDTVCALSFRYFSGMTRSTGTTCRDVPWIRGIVEKAERGVAQFQVT
jgi:hypothetical protein